jgi:hypothetical protein
MLYHSPPTVKSVSSFIWLVTIFCHCEAGFSSRSNAWRLPRFARNDKKTKGSQWRPLHVIARHDSAEVIPWRGMKKLDRLIKYG